MGIVNLALGLLAVCLAANLFSNCKKYEVPPRILVFTKTAGYRHQSIPAGVAALRKLCDAHGVMLDSTENAEDFTEENLCRYAAVVFLNTTGDVLDHRQEADFERFIQAGGGFVGVHAATDTEYGWKWYGGLVGGYFNGHPDQQQATLHVHDHTHPATRHLPAEWSR
ncbi:MAG: ThuA domain-containing protein, partial [Saprospiraceae bacterium]